MSTKFAVEVDGNLIEVAHRSNRQIVWLNPIAKLLKSNIKVIPVDNSHQGILIII